MDDPVLLAVRAHARHAHTEYDDLLAFGWDREEARARVRLAIDDILAKWSRRPRMGPAEGAVEPSI